MMKKKKILNIKKLTSKKTKTVYIILYSIYSILYIISPLFIMKFINSVENKDLCYMSIYSILSIVNYFAIQICSYFFSITVGKVEQENFVGYYKKVFYSVSQHKSEDINDDIEQLMGQYYDQSCDFFFIKRIEFIYSILNVIIIFFIMFIIEWKIALFLLLIVPLSFLITKKFEKKLYNNSEKNIANQDNIKHAIIDKKKLNKEECMSKMSQINNIHDLFSAFSKQYLRSVKDKSVYLYFFSYSLLNFSILLVLLVSGYLSYKVLLPIGTLFAFQNYTSQLWNPFEFLFKYGSDKQEAMPIIYKIEEIFSRNSICFNDEKINSISLEDYASTDVDGNLLFEPINVSFEQNNIYIIKGNNGIGKTTLIESLMGYNQRYVGHILINNQVMNEVYSDYTYIPATPFISKFYDQNKCNESSGNKKLEQLKFYTLETKSVVIFDEPTNFIDENNKNYVIDLIRGLCSNKIVIIITHDPKMDDLSAKTIELSPINKLG